MNPPTPARSRKAPRRGIGAAAAMGLILFGALALLGGAAAVFAVTTFTSMSQGLPDPTTLEDIRPPEQSVVYDRTGKVELARFGDFNRQVVTFDQLPPMLVDATTAVEDRSFWDNSGFDPVGHRLRRASTPSAAARVAPPRSPSSSSASGSSTTRRHRRDRRSPRAGRSRRSSSRSA